MLRRVVTAIAFLLIVVIEFFTFVELDVPENTPTTTPSPTKTQVHSTATPTMDLSNLLGLYQPDFSTAHIPLDEIDFIHLEEIVVVKVVEGKQTTVTETQISVGEQACGGSLLGNVKKVYQAAKKEGFDWHAVGAKVLTESTFKQFVQSSDGTCKLLQNYAGAPAYCMMQIYLPAHPNIKVEDLADIDYCISAGLAVYRSMLRVSGGDSIQAVACYKGFCQTGMAGKNEPNFISNFIGAYNAPGFTIKGENIFIPWDEEELLKAFPDWAQ